MKIAKKLREILAELRELPRRFSREHLLQPSTLEAAKIPVRPESRRTAPPRRRR